MHYPIPEKRQALKTTTIALLVLGLLAAGCSDNNGNQAVEQSALQSVGLVEGRHYSTIANPVFEIGEKFIVHEFFWYGCPHCLAFEPELHRWKKKLLGGIMVEQVPAIWAAPMILHAKVFYLVETLPRENREQIHTQVFNKIIELRKEKSIDVQKDKLAQLLAGHGVTREQFDNALEDEGINSKVKRAERMMKNSGIKSTPTLMVNGRYLVLNDTASDHGDITAIADKIIRAERMRLRNAK